jgi:hypothetical protein
MPKQKTYDILGKDLALTRYVGTPSSVDLNFADSWGTLDLKIVPGGRGGITPKVDVSDMGTAGGRENLAQALILRLLTQQGALAPLGHPDYGSRLTHLIGQRNDERTRNLARLYTIEAISQEKRVTQLLDLNVETVPGQPETIRIGFSVLPLDDDQPLSVGLEVIL